MEEETKQPFTPDHRFKILNDFVGYGNPGNIKILFIGEEEGSEYINDADFSCAMTYREERTYLGPNELLLDNPNLNLKNVYKSPIVHMQAYIAYMLRDINKSETPEFHSAKIWEYYQSQFNHQREFVTNLYPLPCIKQSNWPCQYYGENGLFFRRQINKWEYKNECRQHRIDLIIGLFSKITHDNGIPFTIVFDKTDRTTFKEQIFGPLGINFRNEHPLGLHGGRRRTIQVSEDSKIFLANNVSNGWFTLEDAHFIRNTITKHNLH